MVRAPCCEKTSVKKGPWSHQEDRILIDYINLHGHPNWRALPILAGLSRCGKSCRLRWTNYLRPDIKRGSFSKEEEETIIQLHTVMGNRWSAIAARLPGRTDNEIKNVWHTNLKKRLKLKPNTNDANTSEFEQKVEESKEEGAGLSPFETRSSSRSSYKGIDSPQPLCTDASSVTSSFSDNLCMEDMVLENSFPKMDDEFWLEDFSSESIGYESNTHADMDFWLNVFINGEESIQI